MHVQQFSSFEECKNLWTQTETAVKSYPFQQLWYLELFTKHYVKSDTIFLIGVFEEQTLLALGAFEKVNQTIVFLGTKDVSQNPELIQDITDFGDILYTKEGKENAAAIWDAISSFFREKGITDLQLSYVRQDSPTYRVLSPAHKTTQQEVSPFIVLPQSWDDYLASLDKKQRHELKRKMNRLSQIEYSFQRKEITKDTFVSFIKLHKLSDFNKAKFMTNSMEAFFWDLVSSHKTIWHTVLYTLDIDEKEVSSVLVLENEEQVLLYNSGFDPSFGYYSAGLLGKAFILKKAIEEKKKIYDFLRGNERYKYDLGAKDLPLFHIVLQ